MQSFQYLLLAALATTSVYATQFLAYTDTGCSQGATIITDGDHSGRCSQIGFTPSVASKAVDDGCTLFVYTDSVCKNNPTVAGLGQCVEDLSSGSAFFSYNIKC